MRRSLRRSMFMALSASLAMGGAVHATELGAYRGPGCDGRARMASFERFVGRKVDRTVDALAQTNWADLDSSIDWLTGCWKGSGIALTMSVPMMPRSEGGTFQDGIAGKHDGAFRHAATALVANDFPDAVVRIGWEFNGDWMPWAAAKDPDGFIADYRHIVAVMRSVPGQRFRFEWCPNHRRHTMDPPRAYPGDDVVDVIGMDVYDEYWTPDQADPVARWDTYLNEPFGLKWHKAFAQAHGKPTAYSEWGTGTRPDGHGAGDDPVFIAGMADWFAASAPFYQSYWDNPSPEYNTLISTGQYPRSAAVFVDRFGGTARGAAHGRRAAIGSRASAP